MPSSEEERRDWFRQSVLPLESMLLSRARKFSRQTGVESADLVHETFARVIGYEHWRDVEDAAAFCFSVLKNCALDWTRTRRVVPIGAVADLDRYGGVDEGPDPETAAISRDELEFLQDVVAGLPTQCRRVFVLKRIYGFSHAEIAGRLNISVSTVEKHMVKGQRLCTEAYAKGRPASARDTGRTWSKWKTRVWST